MKYRHYKRIIYEKDKLIYFRMYYCSFLCKNKACGKKRNLREITLMIFQHVFSIEFEKPKGCDIPF